MSAGIVNSLQRDSSNVLRRNRYQRQASERRRLQPRKAVSLLRSSLLLLCITLGIPAANAQSPLRRIVILPPVFAPNAGVEAAVRETKIRRKRPPKPKPGQKPPAASPPLVLEPEAWNEVAQRLYLEALRTRLSARLKLGVASEADTLLKRSELKLSYEAALLPENRIRLAQTLNADAVLVPEQFHLVRRGAGLRTVVLTGTARLFRSDLSEKSFSISGDASADRNPFTGDPNKTDLRLTADAARSAAYATVSTLASGQVFPLALPEVQVAVAPTLSLPAADRLRFTAEGRKAELAAIRPLSSDASAYFSPPLLPVTFEKIKNPESVRRALQREHLTLLSLWKTPAAPNEAQVQMIGKSLNVDYVLLTRVIGAEVDGDAALPSPEGVLFESRAESVGVLVRISDGKVVWTDRVATSLRVRSPEAGGTSKVVSERKAVLEAIRFSLVQLSRRFKEYRNGFLR